MTSEQLLIRNIKSNNRNSFREFVELYKGDVYSIAYRLTGNHSDADDLSQVVFIKFFSTVANYRQETKITSWLYKIAVNSYIDRDRKKVNKLIFRFNNNDDQETSIEETVVSAKTDPEKDTESGIIRDHIDSALTRLSPKERSAFVLKHYHGQSIREIAKNINTSEGTVKSLLFRGVKKLQQALAFYRPELGLGEYNE
jgi:RNA polymerase sigma-70 factor, ECF subfamily